MSSAATLTALLLVAATLLACSQAPAAAAAAATGVCAASGTCSAALEALHEGGLHDRRFAPGLARWYVPDNLPSIWTEDHEDPPISFSEAYGHFVQGPNDIQFFDSHWVRFFYQWVYQMKRSPLRVHSPEAADFIFVPVCLGGFCGGRPTNPLYFKSPAYRWTHSHIDRKTLFFNEAPKLLPWLGKKPHILVYNGAIPGDVLRDTAQHFTFIGLETALTMDPARFLTAPYPSHEHHDIHQPPPPIEPVIQHKQKLAVGIYVVRKAISDGTANTRTLLHKSCTQHADACTHITWDMSHNMTTKAAAYSNYTSHWYCLQPPGDWILRGAFYDCVVAGGVPVVFHPNYTKHVAFSDVFNYTDMIQQAPPATELQSRGGSDFDYLEFLQKQHAAGKDSSSSSSSRAKLAALWKARRVFQYALNPDHYLIRWRDRDTQHTKDDAFTFTMKALLRGLCRQPGFKNSTQCQEQSQPHSSQPRPS